MKLNEYQARLLNRITEETNKDYFDIVAALKRFKRYAATLHRLDENACNGYPKLVREVRDGKVYVYSVEDVAWRERDEKKEESIQQKAELLAKAMGWDFERQGDPRGYPFHVTLRTKDDRKLEVVDVIA